MVPAGSEGSPAAQEPILSCMGVCGYWSLSAVAGVRVRMVLPSMDQVMWSEVQSME